MVDAKDKSIEADPRIICFERSGDDRAFEASLTNLMGKMQEQSRKLFICEDNILRMTHGGNWVHSAREEEPDMTMHTLSAEWFIPFEDIAENDLSLIGRTIHPINETMERQFAENIYSVINATAERVGNVVDAQGAGSIPHSMLEMFRKIEFGVDRDGNISMPQIHAGSEMYERIVNEMQNAPLELEAEIEKVKAEKIQIALDQEAERKAKFKQADV